MPRNLTNHVFLLAFLVSAGVCSATEKATAGPASGAPDGSSFIQDKPVASQPKVKQVRTAKYVLRVAANPTTKSGRGEPSLTDIKRPAAWIHIDGHDGAYGEKDGKPDAAWVIKGKVSASPSFTVEAFSTLLGKPKDFVATLYSEELKDGSKIAYSFKAKKRTFEVGRKYALLAPGNDFVIRNLTTGDVVLEIPPLPAGTYVLAAGVKNLDTGKEALAISRFTVGK